MRWIIVLLSILVLLSGCAWQFPVKPSPGTQGKARININDLEIKDSASSINIQEPEQVNISFEDWANQVEGKPVDPSIGYTSAPYTEENKRALFWAFLGQGFDLGTTIYALSTGDFVEGNPVGFAGVVAVKLAVAGYTYYAAEYKRRGPYQQYYRTKYYRINGWTGFAAGAFNLVILSRED